MIAPVLVWFRNDLRLADNPALTAAATTGQPIVALFVLDDVAPGVWKPGGASRWWLHHSLEALGNALAAHGGRLHLRRGSAERIVADLVRDLGATAVFWNRRYEPWAIAQDKAIKAALQADDVEVHSFNAALGREPWQVMQRSGQPFKVFTPFSRAWLAQGALPPPKPVPDKWRFADLDTASDRLDDWQLLPTAPNWAGGLRATWTPGEASARATLQTFLDEAVLAYDSERDYPGRAGVSRLSPHLRFGEIGPRQIYAAASTQAAAHGQSHGLMLPFLRQLIWRDFAYHTLFHFPQLPERSLRPEFEELAWRDDAAGFRAWSKGLTGYPIVDAGMRQLWQTGWMHNRVRMIVGSFLTKDLLLRWQDGAAWFWDTLVDADLANNSLGWQWIAGAGIDAAPFFRIFNPTTQGEKFDPDGAYVRQWLPELARLSGQWLHQPFKAPAAVLQAAGVRLGESYPQPIVDHAGARQRALAAWQSLRPA